MTSPFKSPPWQKIHGKLIVIIGFAVGLLWVASVWGWNEFLRPRQENYTQAHKDIAELKQRVGRLEKGEQK